MFYAAALKNFTRETQHDAYCITEQDSKKKKGVSCTFVLYFT